MNDKTSTAAEDVVASLRAELARKGRSQTWLADQLGESKHWVSRRFAGQTDLAVEDLIRMAGALDVAPADLMAAS